MAADDGVSVLGPCVEPGRNAGRAVDPVSFAFEAQFAGADRFGLIDGGLDCGLVVGYTIARRAALLDCQ